MEDFTVADVYEHAAKIGQDVERLIREYGEESVEQLMPKIVFTLEQLEGLAERRQKDMVAISDLNNEKERLLIECKREAATRRQAEEKVDYLETMMNEDTKSLQHTIGTLKKENEFLKSEVEELDEEVLTQRKKELPNDINLIVKMKMTIDGQRDEIREANQENERHKAEIEALNEQTNRLTDMNERLRIYNAKLQDRLAETIGHKVQAEATLASVKIANDVANETEVVLTKANEKGSKSKADHEPSDIANEASNDKRRGNKDEKKLSKKAKSTKVMEGDVKTGIVSRQEEDYVIVPKVSNEVLDEGEVENREKDPSLIDSSKDSTKEPLPREHQGTTSDHAKGMESVNKEKENVKPEQSKKDPNRPRYTLAEMQQVLEERNRYKERVSVLEDVLESYVPGPIRSSTLEKNDENLKRGRKESGPRKGTPKREPKVRGILRQGRQESAGYRRRFQFENA